MSFLEWGTRKVPEPVLPCPPRRVYDAEYWRESWPRPVDMPVLAPGVRGYAEQVDGYLWVGSIMSEEPGRGHAARYLDSLPRRAAVPAVFNDRLASMLERRGFRYERCLFWDPRHRECVDGWVRS